MDSALHYSDSREIRIFCFDRYKLSFKLPEIARSLSERSCFHAERGNFLATELVKMGNSEGKGRYEIYFKVSRVTKGNKRNKNLLRLFVQTAYIKDREPGYSERKQIKFTTIACNTQKNKKIKAPPK